MRLYYWKRMTELFLTGYSKINKTGAYAADRLVVTNHTANTPDFLKNTYKQSGMDYPKFYKMDSQSKLGLLAAELLLKDTAFLEKHSDETIGMILSNAAGSEDSDNNFFATITGTDNYFPSPALFVYTLPNIVAGELCIKYKIKGENNFFLTENFDADLLHLNISNLMKYTNTKACIGGWVNYKEETADAFLFTVELVPGKDSQLLNSELLNQLYFN